MKSKITVLLFAAFAMASCTSDDTGEPVILDPITGNKILMLKVDYTTNDFEGGTEFSFDQPATTFTIETEYEEPGDFGWVKLYYSELDTMIFNGEIHWMGLGTLHYPESFEPASSFAHVLTDDYASPEGFENVHNPSGQSYDYNQPWSHVQGLVKVRQYLQSNPTATAKIFLYTPSVGIGNPADWDWIIILKN